VRTSASAVIDRADFKETVMRLNRCAGVLLWGLAATLVVGGALLVHRSRTGEPDPGVMAAVTWGPSDPAAPVCLANLPQAPVDCPSASSQMSYYPVSWQEVFQGAHR
jgi:hypothetical protein